MKHEFSTLVLVIFRFYYNLLYKFIFIIKYSSFMIQSDNYNNYFNYFNYLLSNFTKATCTPFFIARFS